MSDEPTIYFVIGGTLEEARYWARELARKLELHKMPHVSSLVNLPNLSGYRNPEIYQVGTARALNRQQAMNYMMWLSTVPLRYDEEDDAYIHTEDNIIDLEEPNGET